MCISNSIIYPSYVLKRNCFSTLLHFRHLQEYLPNHSLVHYCDSIRPTVTVEFSAEKLIVHCKNCINYMILSFFISFFFLLVY